VVSRCAYSTLVECQADLHGEYRRPLSVVSGQPPANMPDWPRLDCALEAGTTQNAAWFPMW